MVKYLVKRKDCYWYRRKVKGFKEIVFSLKTKNYELALFRHSYIDHKITLLVYKGAFKKMTSYEIGQIVNKYKQYMIEEDMNDFEELRDEELSTTINGKFFGGHTKEALNEKIKQYKELHTKNDLELIKNETAKILKRSNLQEDFGKLTDTDDIRKFHWKLFKAEWDILRKALDYQIELTGQLEPERHHLNDSIANTIPAMQNKKANISISQLISMYINENKAAKDWSDKNERDLKYVFSHLSQYYNDKDISEISRLDFSTFRDEVIKNLPERANQKILNRKNTIEILKIIKKEKLKTIGTTTINKHLRRIHQVFNWADNSGLIEKNLSKDLKIHEKKKSKKQKTAKIPYSNDDLKRIFQESPWFTSVEIMRYNPEYVFIPLLALYTGAKPTELALLKTSAIKEKKGVMGIDFSDMIKNGYSERFTPLSKEIIELDFLKYVKYQQKQRSEQLFPNIKIYQSGGTNFTNDFTIYNRKYITDEKNKTFYSFRHLVNQKLKNKRTPLYIINDIVGHSDGKGNKDIEVYGDEQMPEEVLRDIIDECLVYDLNFSRVKEAINKIY